MKYYFNLFICQLLVIGVAINIRTDVPFWKQLLGYCLVACILPAAEFFDKSSTKEMKNIRNPKKEKHLK